MASELPVSPASSPVPSRCTVAARAHKHPHAAAGDVRPSVCRGSAAARWEGRVCGDVVTLGIAPWKAPELYFRVLACGFILWQMKSPVELEGCFLRLKPAEDCYLGNRGRPLLFYFCEEFSNENRSLPVVSLLDSPCEFLCCLFWILSARLSSVPPHQLPVPPCFIFNKRQLYC